MTKKILFVLLSIFILASCTFDKAAKIYDNGVVVSVSRSYDIGFKYIVHVECYKYSNYAGLKRIPSSYFLLTNKKYNVGDSIKIN